MGRTATATRKSDSKPAKRKAGTKKPVSSNKSPRASDEVRSNLGAPAAPSISRYADALAYLAVQVNYERKPPRRFEPSPYKLDRIIRLMADLGNPQEKFRSVHVAGTKGKGSTVEMLAQMLQGNGLAVGIYTSPHILDVRERIRCRDEMISEGDFTRLMARIAETTADYAAPERPTYFEILTAIAFLYFAEQGVDIAVVETGLGGRLDATNIIKPEACGITSISYDHMSELGATLVDIATEKAGIFKEGVPVVSAPQTKEVKRKLKELASKKGAEILFPGDGISYTYRFESSHTSGPQARICVTTPAGHYDHMAVPLLGEHQAINCGVALGLLDQLKLKGFRLNDESTVVGLSRVRLSGRMEMLCDEPRVMVDGAHNAASVEAVMRAIGQNIPYDSMVVIFGCLVDKDIPGMLRVLRLGADKVIFTGVKSPRSADPADLAKRFADDGGRMAQVAGSLAEAVEIAEKAVSREDLICITGSFYLAGEAKRHFEAHPHRAGSTPAQVA